MLEKKKKFTVIVVRHWNRVPRELLELPSLEVLKSCQDLGLSNGSWFRGCRASSGLTVELGPFHP